MQRNGETDMNAAEVQAAVTACDHAHEAMARTRRIIERIYPMHPGWALRLADPFTYQRVRNELSRSIYSRIMAKVSA
jgi:hypothetical protein